HTQRDSLDEQFAALDRCEFFVRALSDFVGISSGGEPLGDVLGDAVESCRAVIELEPGSDEQRHAREAAKHALDRYIHVAAETVSEGPAAPSAAPSSAVAIGVCLRRILETHEEAEA